MFRMHPMPFFFLVLVLFAAAAWAGQWIRAQRGSSVEREDGSLKTLESALLALLGLLLGFTFSMAISRFEERKQLEIAEANNIGTLWLRTSLLSDAGRSAERALIRQYVPVRIQFLASGTSEEGYAESLQRGSDLQAQMWHVANVEALQRRDPETALFIAALNDSIDATEKRTAAFENRIPAAAWALLVFIGTVSSLFVGIGLRARSLWLRIVLPVVMAAVLAMTYDIDSPRSGVIRVEQQSMLRVQQQVNAVPVN